MSEIVIPVALSLILGPGAGQLYNREFKKGSYLIALSLVVLIGAFAWFRQAMLPYLPADLTTLDPAAVPSLVQNAVNHVVSSHSGVVFIYETMLSALWIYGVVDAYRVARRKQQDRRRASGH